MILIFKKNRVIFTLLIILLSLVLYGIEFIHDVSSAVTTNTEIKSKIVLIDPGHGGEDPGAVSDFSGLKEKDVNLYIAKRLRDLLTTENYKVLMTREEDRLEYQSETKGIVQKRKQDLLRRKKMMDDEATDIVVSIHLNKFPEGKYSGAQTFYPSNSPQSQRLALCLQDSIKRSVDPNNKRTALEKKEPIIILNNNKAIISIVECGFLSNPNEEKLLVTREYQDKVATAIFEGIKEYFKK